MITTSILWWSSLGNSKQIHENKNWTFLTLKLISSIQSLLQRAAPLVYKKYTSYRYRWTVTSHNLSDVPWVVLNININYNVGYIYLRRIRTVFFQRSLVSSFPVCDNSFSCGVRWRALHSHTITQYYAIHMCRLCVTVKSCAALRVTRYNMQVYRYAHTYYKSTYLYLHVAHAAVHKKYIRGRVRGILCC